MIAAYSNLITAAAEYGIAKSGERRRGDVVLLQRDGDRLVAVLSDGLGSGVRAGVLADLTASTALHLTLAERNPDVVAEVVARSLPVDPVRGIGYATFSIVDVGADGATSLVEFGNPPAMILDHTGGVADPPARMLEHDGGPGRRLTVSRFHLSEGDRLLVCSDGVSQAGLGRADSPLGWGETAWSLWARERAQARPAERSRALAQALAEEAQRRDGDHAKDDITALVVHRRQPRRCTVFTGPPYRDEDDECLADRVATCTGTLVACGGTTASIIARELNRRYHPAGEVTPGHRVPPLGDLSGFDLCTEGALTLQRAIECLESPDTVRRLPGRRDAGECLADLLCEHERVDLVVGSAVNPAHQDPSLPVELGVRRILAKRLARVLEDRWLIEVGVEFI